MLRLLGHFFDREIKIGDLMSRNKPKPLVAKSRGNRAFKGDLIVLVDSESGSASEVFARVIQLEKRGTVIGDRSAGMVMKSRRFGHQLGMGRTVFYGISVTIADLIMTDGKSLERKGVIPDEIVLPMATDLASGSDPVMSRAAALAGVNIAPEEAGALFPKDRKE